MLATILAHGGGAGDSGLMLLAFAPVGLILLIGFVIVLRPVVSGTTHRDEREEDTGQGPRV